MCESIISSAISSFSLHGYQSPLYIPFLVYPVSQPLSSSVSLSLSLPLLFVLTAVWDML